MDRNAGDARLERGQMVRVTYQGLTKPARVVLVSTNQRSLMLGFDGMFGVGDGAYFGSMPVLRDDRGAYRDLVQNKVVSIESAR